MGMTLKQAIEHAREKADELRTSSNNYVSECEINKCLTCAEEHDKLAEWLEELEALREARDTFTLSLIEEMDKARESNNHERHLGLITCANLLTRIFPERRHN